jgi:5-methylcytosine-specific restriction protein A
MAKEWAKKFYNSKAWQKCREGYIDTVHGLCETCLDKNKLTPGYILHHKTWLTPENINDPNITLNWDNLKYECQDCHNKEGSTDKEIVREGLMFNEYGELVEG